MSKSSIYRAIICAQIDLRQAQQALTACGLNPPSEWRARQKLRDAIEQLRKAVVQ
jgi:hypothetical protein